VLSGGRGVAHLKDNYKHTTFHYRYLFNFLAVATTTLLASAIARQERGGPRRVVSAAFALTLFAGLLQTAALQAGAVPLLTLFSGGQPSPETLGLSLAYVRIRALGAVPALLSMVAQAACVGAKDSKSPLRAVVMQVHAPRSSWRGPQRNGRAGGRGGGVLARAAERPRRRRAR